MNALLLRVNNYIVRKLWVDVGPAPQGRVKAFVVKALRVLYLFAAEFSDEQLALRSMSLVYTALLSLVPLLAVSFSVLKAFGVHAKLLIVLYYFLEPLGDKGVDLSMKIIEFVENVKVSVIGAFGLSALIYTVMSLLQKIEAALSYIWHIRTMRSFAQRFSSYMSMLLAGPVLVFSAASVATSVTEGGVVKGLLKIQALGPLLSFAAAIVPYLVVSAAFSFIYLVLPNIRVRASAAVSGGIFAGTLWTVVGHVFTFLIASPAKYSAVYSGFAILLLFLIWLYWNFFILLAGARVSYYVQYPRMLAARKGSLPLSGRLRERLGLLIMLHIGHSFYHNKTPWNSDTLAGKLGVSADGVQQLVALLLEAGLIVSSGEERPGLFLARDMETIAVGEIIEAVRRSGENGEAPADGLSLGATVDEILRRRESAAAQSTEGMSLKELVLKS